MEDLLDKPDRKAIDWNFIRLIPFMHLSLMFLINLDGYYSIDNFLSRYDVLAGLFFIILGYTSFFKSSRLYLVISICTALLLIPGIIKVSPGQGYMAFRVGRFLTLPMYPKGVVFAIELVLVYFKPIMQAIMSLNKPKDGSIKNSGETNHFKQKFQNKSDNELERIVQNDNMSKGAIKAAREILNERSKQENNV